eukprot:scaffold132715_cov60-Phaeocystis_antarctica.AAC.1
MPSEVRLVGHDAHGVVVHFDDTIENLEHDMLRSIVDAPVEPSENGEIGVLHQTLLRPHNLRVLQCLTQAFDRIKRAEDPVGEGREANVGGTRCLRCGWLHVQHALVEDLRAHGQAFLVHAVGGYGYCEGGTWS